MGRKTFRKVITSPDLIKQINPENVKLMERFLKNYSTKKSPNTIVNYRSNLQIFFCWLILEDRNIPYVDLKKMDFMDFFDYAVLELKWSSNRFHQCHSTLSSFSRWIERVMDETYPNFRNLLPYIDKPDKEVVRKKSVYTQEELDQLMDWLGENNKVQEQCLLALLLATGARFSEIPRFKTSIIDEDNTAFEGLFLETTEEMQVKGRGVNGKHIVRYIIKDIFLPYYYKWLPIREEIMKKHNQNHDSIFILRDGSPAKASSMKFWIQKWDEYCTEKFGKPVYFHMFRHRWTSYLLGIGVEKELVQEMQNWCSDQLCDLYNDNTAKDRKWKGLDKLKTALEQDEMVQKTQQVEGKIEEEKEATKNST